MKQLKDLTINKEFKKSSYNIKAAVFNACINNDHNKIKDILLKTEAKKVEQLLDASDKNGNTVFDYIKDDETMVDFILDIRGRVEEYKLKSFSTPSIMVA